MDKNNLKIQLKEINVIKQDNNINSNAKILLNKHPILLQYIVSTTSFLDMVYDSVSLQQRLHAIRNDIIEVPICQGIECSSIVKYNKTRGYNSFCSQKCNGKDVNIQEKKKNTCLKNHGVENPSQSSDILDKKKSTFIEKYGVENPFQSDAIKEKSKKTCQKKYGKDYYVQTDEFRDKFTETMNEKYGVDHAAQSSVIKEKTKNTNLDRYGVEHSSQLKEIHDKVTQMNLKNYGVVHSSQINITSCVLEKLNNKDWLHVEHYVNQKTLTQIAKDLDGIDKSMVSRYLHSHGLETQNYFQSTGEKQVLKFINSLDIQTVPNSRNIIPPYEIDIYIPEHNLAIEYCGLYWHSEQAGKDKYYHKKKHDLCSDQGIQLLTIFEDEWFQRQEQVKSKLKSLLNKDDRERIFARKTKIINVSKKSKQTFFDENHIQSNGPGSINIGLLFDNQLVACMSFIVRKNNVYELNRYATSAQVVGGFSKLLKYFQNNYTYEKITSFADLRWSTGNLYTKTGWKQDSIINPDYQYSPDGKKRFHKFNYRRKNLPKLLHSFVPELSERINCDNNGILRIWDCGKIRFIITH